MKITPLGVYQIMNRLIAVELSRQKELHAHPKAIQQVEFFEKFKK